MLLLLVRTGITYWFLGLIMRWMGKRQLAQLETSELITTLLLSELAALPLGNPDIPLTHALLPIALLATLERLTSLLLLRHPRLRRRDRNTPSLLICRGSIDQEQLRSNRLTPEELFSALRQQGIADPTEVQYAILEKNGVLTVLPCAAARPLTPADLGQSPAEDGMMHLLVSDGVIQTRTLSSLGHDRRWLEGLCAANGLRIQDALCVMCNDAGRVILVPRHTRGKNGQGGCRPWQEGALPK